MHTCSLFLITLPVLQALIVISPPTLRERTIDGHIPSPMLPHGIRFTSMIEAPVVMATNPCHSIDQRIDGHILLVKGRDGCAVEFPIRHAEDAGAIAIIFGGEFAVAGFFSTIHDGKATKDVSIPVFEVGRHSYQQLVSELTNGQNVSVQLVAEDVNQWDIMRSSVSMTIFQIVFSGLSLMSIWFAIQKLILFIKEKKHGLGIAHITLILEGMSNFVRLIYYVTDPIFAKGTLSYPVGRMLLSFSAPLMMITCTFLAFYWHDVLNNTGGKTITFVATKKSRIIVSVICIFVFAVNLLSSLYQALYKSSIFSPAMAFLLMTLVQMTTAIVFISSGSRLIKAMTKNKGGSTSKQDNLKKMARRIIFSAIFMVIFCIAGSLASTPIYGTPWGFFAVWCLAFGASQGISWNLIGAFVPAKWHQRSNRLASIHGKIAKVVHDLPIRQSISSQNSSQLPTPRKAKKLQIRMTTESSNCQSAVTLESRVETSDQCNKDAGSTPKATAKRPASTLA